MSPLSNDPEQRSKQLQNLRPGRGAAGVGNARAISHGAYAAITAERLDAKTLEVAAALSADAPVRAEDGGLPAADTAAMRLLADVLCRLDDIAAYLLRRGWEDEDGKPRPVLEYEARLRNHAVDLLRELAMTPKSRAALGLDLVRARSAADEGLERLQRIGAEIIEAREARDGDQ